jgi:predicted Zn-dependent peptidase
MAFVVNFTCNPKERERIAGDIDRLMHEIADGDLITQELIDGYIQQREKNVRTLGDSEQLDLFTKRELYKWYPDENDLTYIRKVTPKMLKAHLRQLLKKCNLHIGYLTTE